MDFDSFDTPYFRKFSPIGSIHAGFGFRSEPCKAEATCGGSGLGAGAVQILLQDRGTHFEFARVGADNSQLRGLALAEQLKKTFSPETACIQ